MRFRFLAACASAVLAASAFAQMKPQPQSPIRIEYTKAKEASEQAPRISKEEAEKLYKEGKAVFVDVRTEHTYSVGHIKGALSIPGSQLAMRITEIPPKKKIITYCACHAEETAGLAVAILKAHGIKDAAALKGGWLEWRDSHYPVEGMSVR
ncbi:MAG TPA: rhodanese-like domain-containing protein [Thermoanaerobaculia bacterium]|jgi:rhodanese-related sulfurtransferase|nr:rhodanese-like domain-containing protein [Thermoanaerobaculia bacterium]